MLFVQGVIIAMNITMLGTGNALVTECYNTCFILHDGDKRLLVDTGGGNGILHQLKHAGFQLTDIHNIFITHSHIDHILGIIWVIRISAQLMNRGMFDGDINIYSHDEVITLIDDMAQKLLLPYQYDFVGKRIHFHTVIDNETENIAGHNVKFFDIHSERTKQFGFVIGYDDGKRLTFCGDEPCHTSCERYVSGSDWLIHEAFCLYSEADTFRPYEKHHSTVKDACILAERLGVKNILLTHTEDTDLAHRKERYTEEGRRYFGGNIFIPDDLETLTL